MVDRKISRRRFLRLGALTAAGRVLAACAPEVVTKVEEREVEVTREVEVEKPVEVEVTREVELTAMPLEPQEVNLTFWGWWDIRMEKYAIAASAFMEANPEVTIEVVTLPSGGDLVEKTYSSVAAGTGPNILKMSEFFFPMKDADLLLQFPEDVFPASWYRESYPTVYWPAYEGYVVPTGTDCSILYYNKRIFEEADLDPESPPKTWDQFVEAAKACAQSDDGGLLTQVGYVASNQFPVWNQAFQLGATVVAGDGDVTANLNTEEWIAAWQWMYDLYHTHQVASVDFPGVSESLGTGLAAMSDELTWVIGNLKGNFEDTFPDMGYAPPPTPTGEPDPLYGWKGTVLSCSALKNGRVQDYPATIRFLEFLYKEGGRDTFKELSILMGVPPVRADLVDDPDILALPGMDVALEVEPLEYDNVNRPDPALRRELWLDTWFRIITEQEPIPAVLDDANAGLQEMIDSGLADGIR